MSWQLIKTVILPTNKLKCVLVSIFTELLIYIIGPNIDPCQISQLITNAK